MDHDALSPLIVVAQFEESNLGSAEARVVRHTEDGAISRREDYVEQPRELFAFEVRRLSLLAPRLPGRDYRRR
jgi:hypothetical protein